MSNLIFKYCLSSSDRSLTWTNQTGEEASQGGDAGDLPDQVLRVPLALAAPVLELSETQHWLVWLVVSMTDWDFSHKINLTKKKKKKTDSVEVFGMAYMGLHLPASWSVSHLRWQNEDHDLSACGSVRLIGQAETGWMNVPIRPLCPHTLTQSICFSLWFVFSHSVVLLSIFSGNDAPPAVSLNHFHSW